ncbi:MAG: hypothetical protein HKN24_01025 [Acidimicrobiales bacterium]|nr:hypothetical protein [Acidimicrobiales bacterium]
MTAEITMTLPAESRFVATTRVTSASLAAELEFGVNRIEELRAGVNELAAVLVEWAEDHDAKSMTLTFRVDDDQLEVIGEVVDGNTSNGAQAGLDALTAQILAGVTDEYEISGGRGRIVKRRDPE